MNDVLNYVGDRVRVKTDPYTKALTTISNGHNTSIIDDFATNVVTIAEVITPFDKNRNIKMYGIKELNELGLKGLYFSDEIFAGYEHETKVVFTDDEIKNGSPVMLNPSLKPYSLVAHKYLENHCYTAWPQNRYDNKMIKLMRGNEWGPFMYHENELKVVRIEQCTPEETYHNKLQSIINILPDEEE